MDVAGGPAAGTAQGSGAMDSTDYQIGWVCHKCNYIMPIFARYCRCGHELCKACQPEWN